MGFDGGGNNRRGGFRRSPQMAAAAVGCLLGWIGVGSPVGRLSRKLRPVGCKSLREVVRASNGGLNAQQRAPPPIRSSASSQPPTAAEGFLCFFRLFALAVNNRGAVGGAVVRARP